MEFAPIVAKPRVPLIKTIAGRIFAICFRVFARQIVQFVINFKVVEFHAGISAGQHDDIVKEYRRHFFASANFSTAGNHESAWLSPKRTIVVFEVLFPYMHVAVDAVRFC